MKASCREHPPFRHRSDELGSVKAILLVALLAILLAALWLLPAKQYLVGFLEWTSGLGAWGPVFVAGFYVVACVLFLPGSVLTLGAGFLFGVGIGTLTVWIGSNLGAWAAFLVGRTIARDWVARKVGENPRFAALDTAIGKAGFKIILLLRLSPVFPFNLLNYSLGLTRVPFRQYALASLIGMVPGMLMYVYQGSAARSLANVAAGTVEGGIAGKVFFWIGLAATVVAALVVTRVARKALQAAEESIRTQREQIGERVAPPPVDDEAVEVIPQDDHNRELLENTHPPGWVNPEPAERYNLVVLGAGTAGLVTAAGAAGLGAKGTDEIIGATIVAAHAGEMISEITLAMVGKLGLGTLAGVIHPYPTQAEAIKQVADAYNRTRLTPFLKKAFSKWLTWTR